MFERRLLAEHVLREIKKNLKSDYEPTADDVILEQICHSISQTEERCRILIQGQLEAKRTIRQIKDNNSHLEDYLHQCFRQRYIRLCTEDESEEDVSTDPHVIAIRRNSSKLKENLQLEGTMLLDSLIENDVLSDAGRQSILARKTTIAKNAAFLDYVVKSFDESSFRTVFLPELEKEHAHLAAALLKDINLPQANFPAVRQCQSCEAKSKLNIRKFANHLHQSGFITECLSSELASPDVPASVKWDVLCKKMKNLKHVMTALSSFNERIFLKLQTSKSNLLVCTCDELSTIVQMSDVTDTGEDQHGEADVARMSDLLSEVGSILSASTESERSHLQDAAMMKAPLPPSNRDRPILSPKLQENMSPNVDESAVNTSLTGITKFECYTCTWDVFKMENLLSLRFKEMQILKFRLNRLKRNKIKNALRRPRGTYVFGGYRSRSNSQRSQAS